MENTTLYTGIYKDENQESKIEILNDGFNLIFELEGLKFCSDDLETWTLENKDELSDELFDKYSLNSHTAKVGFSLETEYYLQGYEICFNVPQQFLDAKSVKEITLDLQVSTSSKSINLKVELPNQVVVEEKKIPDFELGLKRICNQIKKHYILFNCLTCRYSSYSIYGNGIFGTLLCFKENKEKFLKIKDKEEYSHIQQQGFESVQETSYCSQFQLPTRGQFLYKESFPYS